MYHLPIRFSSTRDLLHHTMTKTRIKFCMVLHNIILLLNLVNVSFSGHKESNIQLNELLTGAANGLKEKQHLLSIIIFFYSERTASAVLLIDNHLNSVSFQAEHSPNGRIKD